MPSCAGPWGPRCLPWRCDHNRGAGGAVVRTLRVVGAFPGLGAQRPGGPACPAGVPISPEKWGERGPGLRPWTPGFMARSLSFARFGDRCLWYDSGAVTFGILRPIWDAFFRKKYAGKHFCERKFSTRCAPTPKAFPSGGRWAGEAGSDEGAILYPTFPCRKGGSPGRRPNGFLLLLRWATRSPPHPSPSVTASPQGEASGLCSPTRKKRPKSGHVGGLRNRHAIAPLRYPPPKRASGNERAIKNGEAGVLPRDSLRPGFLLEKAWIPRPGPGGEPRCRF